MRNTDSCSPVGYISTSPVLTSFTLLQKILPLVSRRITASKAEILSFRSLPLVTLAVPSWIYSCSRITKPFCRTLGPKPIQSKCRTDGTAIRMSSGEFVVNLKIITWTKHTGIFRLSHLQSSRVKANNINVFLLSILTLSTQIYSTRSWTVRLFISTRRRLIWSKLLACGRNRTFKIPTRFVNSVWTSLILAVIDAFIIDGKTNTLVNIFHIYTSTAFVRHSLAHFLCLWHLSSGSALKCF